ncbi:MAG: hypothetical protein L0228_18470 [Planctomycetes bacterium]|nr:hypothetical protein [Planctomycetota bacterium]
MSDAVETTLKVIGGMAALWLIISASGALPLLMLSKVKLNKLSDEQARVSLDKVFASGFVRAQWLNALRFQPVGVYAVPNQIAAPQLVVWKLGNERTYLCIYLLAGKPGSADILTNFDEGGVTTGTKSDALLVPPRPNRWVQAFTVSDVGEQWTHHKEALEFMQKATGQRPSIEEIEFDQEFVGSVRAHIAYVRSLPLWFLRIPYWYVARRFGLFGKTVAQQYERTRGRVPLT